MGQFPVPPLARARTASFLPLPWDATSYERRGAARGARDLARFVSDGAAIGVMLPGVEGGFTHPNDHDRFCLTVKARLADAGLPFIGLGGDHSVTLPLLESAQRHEPGRWGLLVLDAHADLQPELPTNRHSSGSVIRRIVDLGLVDPDDVVIAGVRAATEKQTAYAGQVGIRMVSAREVCEAPMITGRSVARQLAGCDAVHVSVDLDVLNPVLYPGVTVPCPDGLNLPECVSFLGALLGLPVRSGDVTEYRPESDRELETLYAGGEIASLLAQLATVS